MPGNLVSDTCCFTARDKIFGLQSMGVITGPCVKYAVFRSGSGPQTRPRHYTDWIRPGADEAMKDSDSLSYRDAGVDIDAGNALVEAIKPLVRATRRPEVLGNLGGFAGLFELPPDKYRQPVLVSGTDGVGTKLRLAIASGKHDTIGIDLVAMCVNDVLVTGAEPLFFLDYYATGKLSVPVATDVIRGIAEGCRQSGMALIGGETAEMPGIYGAGDYDLAGFCVGVCEKDKLLNPENISAGDVLLGLASSGPHSNGYSLIRKILERKPDASKESLGGQSILQWLLTPTRIYARAIEALLENVAVGGLAHITGGGLPENLPRSLPGGMGAKIQLGSWQRPEIFDWLEEAGRIAPAEMLRTFNCGIGMVAIVPRSAVGEARAVLEAAGERVFEIGEVRADISGLEMVS